MKKIYKFIIALVIPQLAGAAGSVFTASAVKGWYLVLAKPVLNPPNWVFAPVWTGLFLLLGIALYLVWEKEILDKKSAYWIFGVQLFLNFLWSVLFFGLRSPGWAYAEICLLWLAIIFNILLFRKISRTAAWLLVPYLLWVTFAAYLNFSIWRLN